MEPNHVTFGVSLGSFGNGLVPAPTLCDWAAAIERLGFATVWYRDHVVWHSPVLDPFTMLGAFAARTRHLGLATGVLLLPLRTPAVVAKAVATLDQLSGGRAVLGVGVGGEFPKEFEACGVPPAERGRRADEALDAILGLWTGSPVSAKGRFVSFADVRMEPAPLQRPHPPIWVGGRSDAALARAARWGDGWLAYFVTPERLARSVERLEEHRRAHAARAAPLSAGLVLYVCVAPSREEARRVAAAYLAAEYRQPFDGLVDRYCALGPPDACAETMSRFVEAGADHLALLPTREPGRFMDELARLAADVLPHVRGVRRG